MMEAASRYSTFLTVPGSPQNTLRITFQLGIIRTHYEIQILDSRVSILVQPDKRTEASSSGIDRHGYLSVVRNSMVPYFVRSQCT